MKSFIYGLTSKLTPTLLISRNFYRSPHQVQKYDESLAELPLGLDLNKARAGHFVHMMIFASLTLILSRYLESEYNLGWASVGGILLIWVLLPVEKLIQMIPIPSRFRI